jgi:hypothetical protein
MRLITTCALALALAPAAAFAQGTGTTPPPPAGQQPATPAAQPATPAPPKVPFTTPAGILLVQIKPASASVFEEMMGKLRAGLAKTQDPTLKQQAAGFKVYKATEPFGTNTLYVVFLDPAVPNSEYELFHMLLQTMTPEEQRAPDAQAMWTRYADAFATGLNKISLTPLAGG